MSETRDPVSVYIDSMLLRRLPPSRSIPTIFRVDHASRNGSQKLYDPRLVSIGPYHHQTAHLQKMLPLKIAYLNGLLKRRGESNADRYVEAVRSMEEEARNSYSETIELNTDDFVKILVLDGLFVVELLRKYTMDELRETDDLIFRYSHVLEMVQRDLMLIENQVPFFVLDRLFAMTRSNDDTIDDIFEHVRTFTYYISPWCTELLAEKLLKINADHLLGLVHNILLEEMREESFFDIDSPSASRLLGTRDVVSDEIDSLILQLPSSPIFQVRVDHGSEYLNDPKIISIGPFHHQKAHLQITQQLKITYLKDLLAGGWDSTVNRYVVAMRSLEEKARNFYSESETIGQLNPDELVKILVVDGLFVVELLQRNTMDEMRETDDPIFGNEQVLFMVQRDLMLVKNQLPFFVLLRLFKMTRGWNPWDGDVDEVLYRVRCFAGKISPLAKDYLGTLKPEENNTNDHLLGLVCKIVFGKTKLERYVVEIDSPPAFEPPENWFEKMKQAAFDWLTYKILFEKKEADMPVGVNLTVSELQETGVEFKVCYRRPDITFDGGVLKMWILSVDEHTESILKNLITYEQFLTEDDPIRPKCVSHYITFLNFLVKRPRDVEILRRHGILKNSLGEDELVCRVLRSLWESNVELVRWCRYEQVQEALNRYCDQRVIRWTAVCRRWMAELWRNYFNSPWSFIKFCAASLLLVLTVIQTVFTVLSYTKSSI
ncbi:Unknown protein [Striga hermonthica]|uniref:Uncharacterized protein n=1 Tax=Striga hermonthica TaxID=68872 RepID=A0A9N7R1D3_STRHE|nr:Unknown protein [Striga hermonthica]